MDIPPEPYDFNFCFPLPEVLESERLKLVSFIPSKHGHLFMDQALIYPEVFDYLPFGPFKDLEEFLDLLVEGRIRKDPGLTLFAIFDKTKRSPERTTTSPANADAETATLAGVLGLLNSSTVNLATEIGCVIILPPFQRTHVASNAVGLLLHYALDLPSPATPHSLGLRRVFWQANALNKGSIRLAERMGFKMEGILRWDRVLPIGKESFGNGGGVREGDPRAGCVGRDTAMLSLCWDDWEAGTREKVNEVMRRVK